MSDYSYLDADTPTLTPCSGCGARFSIKQGCACCNFGKECEAVICFEGTFCAHTVECERCHCYMLRAHAYDAGDHYLCYPHGQEHEQELGDPRDGVPKGC